MMRIPLSNIPNQRFSVVLDGQNESVRNFVSMG